MQRGKPPGNFRWIRGVRSWQLDPERLRLQRIRSIIKSIQRDLDEGARARVRQIMNGPELFRIELRTPRLVVQPHHDPDRETLTSLLEATPEQTVRSCMTFGIRKPGTAKPSRGEARSEPQASVGWVSAGAPRQEVLPGAGLEPA
jgi:hypothetical protein